MRIRRALLFLPLFFLVTTSTIHAFDHSDWDLLLRKYVKDGLVDYKTWKQDQAGLSAYLDRIKVYSLEDFSRDSREDRIALWINAYNASVILRILELYPIKSVRDIPDFWTKKSVLIASMDYNLSEIRDQVFRKRFRDERASLALIAGYQSSGPLRSEAYQGARLIEQLKDQINIFLSNTRYNQIQERSKKIKLSPLLKEFREDFVLGYGTAELDDQFKPGEIAILGFLRTHIQDQEVVSWIDRRKYKIKYLKEDWSLNEYQEK